VKLPEYELLLLFVVAENAEVFMASEPGGSMEKNSPSICHQNLAF
jgi:hypothetical protein